MGSCEVRDVKWMLRNKSMYLTRTSEFSDFFAVHSRQRDGEWAETRRSRGISSVLSAKKSIYVHFNLLLVKGHSYDRNEI